LVAQLYPFLTSAPDECEVVSFTSRPLFPGRNVPGTHRKEHVWEPQSVWTLWRRKSSRDSLTRIPWSSEQ